MKKVKEIIAPLDWMEEKMLHYAYDKYVEGLPVDDISLMISLTMGYQVSSNEINHIIDEINRMI